MEVLSLTHGVLDREGLCAQSHTDGLNGGADFDNGTQVETGRTVVPASSATDQEDGWTSAQVWIPEEMRDPAGALKVRFEGIGTLGDSDVLFGLTGNGAGAAYSVRQFTPVFYDAPELTATQAPALLVLREARHGLETVRSGEPEDG